MKTRTTLLAVIVAAVLAITAGLALVGGDRLQRPAGDVVTVAGTKTVDVTLAAMRITPSKISVAKGTHLILRVTNRDVVRHDLKIEGGPQTPLLTTGQSRTLDLGTVTQSAAGWCTVPGHRAAGMTMSIVVDGAAPVQAADGGQSGMAGMTGASGANPADAAYNVGATPAPGWHASSAALPPVPSGTTHEVTFTVTDHTIEVAPGVRQKVWTYNGTVPGPILHGKIGDRFVVKLINKGDMPHGIDFHASQVAPDQAMRTINPGESLTYSFVADHSGAWLYHCSTMPVSLHITNGMYGAVIVDPPGLTPAQNFVFVQGELYLGPQGGTADEAKLQAREPDAVVFNGYANQYKFQPISVKVGERIRIWVVDAGPQFGTSFHVVGAQFDTVFKEGAYLLQPNNPQHGAASTLDLDPGQGGFVELTLGAPGHYPFMDHAMVFGEHGAEGTFLAH